MGSSPSRRWAVPLGADPASCPGFRGCSSEGGIQMPEVGGHQCPTFLRLPHWAKVLTRNGCFAIRCWVEFPPSLAQRTIFPFPSWAQSGHPQYFELLVDFPSLPLSLDSFSIKPVKPSWGQLETPLTPKMGLSKVHF